MLEQSKKFYQDLVKTQAEEPALASADQNDTEQEEVVDGVVEDEARLTSPAAGMSLSNDSRDSEAEPDHDNQLDKPTSETAAVPDYAIRYAIDEQYEHALSDQNQNDELTSETRVQQNTEQTVPTENHGVMEEVVLNEHVVLYEEETSGPIMLDQDFDGEDDTQSFAHPLPTSYTADAAVSSSFM